MGQDRANRPRDKTARARLPGGQAEIYDNQAAAADGIDNQIKANAEDGRSSVRRALAHTKSGIPYYASQSDSDSASDSALNRAASFVNDEKSATERNGFEEIPSAQLRGEQFTDEARSPESARGAIPESVHSKNTRQSQSFFRGNMYETEREQTDAANRETNDRLNNAAADNKTFADYSADKSDNADKSGEDLSLPEIFKPYNSPDMPTADNLPILRALVDMADGFADSDDSFKNSADNCENPDNPKNSKNPANCRINPQEPKPTERKSVISQRSQAAARLGDKTRSLRQGASRLRFNESEKTASDILAQNKAAYNNAAANADIPASETGTGTGTETGTEAKIERIAPETEVKADAAASEIKPQAKTETRLSEAITNANACLPNKDTEEASVSETPQTKQDLSENANRQKPNDSDNPNGETEKPSKPRSTGDEQKAPPETIAGKRAEKARLKADRAVERLENAKAKLPKKRKIKYGKTFDAQSGTVKRGLRFETEVKSQSEHIKGAAVSRPVKLGANAAIVAAHRKIYQAEEDNVAVKAAHRTEMAAEGAIRIARRNHKTALYRNAERLERKASKLNMNASYQKAAADNAKLKGEALAKAAQKRNIKKQYAKAAREAKKTAGGLKKTGEIIKKTGDIIKKAGEAVVQAVSQHPAVIAVILVLGFMIIIISSFTASCSNMTGGIGAMVTASSYLAEDSDIDGAELLYTEWETNLLLQIDGTEVSHTGYDEYRYHIGQIGHNPYELISYLTARYQDYTLAAIESDLRTLFDEQYKLTFEEITETKYRDDGTGNIVPYDWRVLTVTLTSRSFYDVSYNRLTDKQKQVFALLTQTKGNRQYAQNPLSFNWLPFITAEYGWRIDPITGAKQYHKGVDIAVPPDTPIKAASGGTVTVGFDAGGYGNYIVIDDGKGLVTKYAYCGTISVSNGDTVKQGDIIALSGISSNTSEPCLHFEVMKNGLYLNPVLFAQTGGSPIPVVYGFAGAAMGDEAFAALLAEAESHIGKPYRWGAVGPNGFDCSGFISAILNNSGTANVGRRSAQGLYNLCSPVSASELKSGDLVFLTGTYSSIYPVTHVALYIGGNTVIHAGDPVGYARIDTAWWQAHLYGYGRLP